MNSNNTGKRKMKREKTHKRLAAFLSCIFLISVALYSCERVAQGGTPYYQMDSFTEEQEKKIKAAFGIPEWSNVTLISLTHDHVFQDRSLFLVFTANESLWEELEKNFSSVSYWSSKPWEKYIIFNEVKYSLAREISGGRLGFSYLVEYSPAGGKGAILYIYKNYERDLTDIYGMPYENGKNVDGFPVFETFKP